MNHHHRLIKFDNKHLDSNPMNTKLTQLASIFIFAALLCISCGKKQPDTEVEAEPEMADTLAIESQKHINRYFHREVIHKFRQGWTEISDSGKSVTFEYTYTRDRDRWIFDQVRTEATTLKGSNDSLALALMSSATAGTVFPATIFKEDSLLTLFWTWPVPFPEGTFDHEKGEFVAHQGTGGSSEGCDGHGTKAFCKTCSNHKCLTVCVGYKTCNEVQNSCEAKQRCASGGPFGSLSGNVIQ